LKLERYLGPWSRGILIFLGASGTSIAATYNTIMNYFGWAIRPAVNATKFLGKEAAKLAVKDGEIVHGLKQKIIEVAKREEVVNKTLGFAFDYLTATNSTSPSMTTD